MTLTCVSGEIRDLCWCCLTFPSQVTALQAPSTSTASDNHWFLHSSHLSKSLGLQFLIRSIMRVCHGLRKFGEELVNLFGELWPAPDILGIFDRETLRNFVTLFADPNRHKSLLATLTNNMDLDGCLVLAGNGWLAWTTSSKHILRTHISFSTSKRDPRLIKHTALIQFALKKETGKTICNVYSLVWSRLTIGRLNTPPFVFPEPLPHYISLEGDVRQVPNMLLYQVG
jgi:hypothetical protein